MRIGDSQRQSGVFQWNKTQKELSKVQEKLATGKAVNRASDDAAMSAVIQEFDKQVRALRGSADNIDTGMNALAISDGGSSAIGDMLQRQRDLALQASNGTLNGDQRAAIDTEYQALSKEIDRISQSTDFNGQPLLNGQGPLADGSGKIQAGAGASTSDQIQVSGSDLSTSSLGTSGTSLTSAGGAEQALRNLDSALHKVSSNRADRGALYNRLEFASESNQSQWVNTTRSLSQIQDVDMAQAVTEETRLNILSHSNQAAISQFNQISRTHLLGLLQG